MEILNGLHDAHQYCRRMVQPLSYFFVFFVLASTGFLKIRIRAPEQLSTSKPSTVKSESFFFFFFNINVIALQEICMGKL